MRQKDLISVKNLNFMRHSQWVVKNLNFTLQRGECMALVGANGTGKTTILNLLAGLLSPQSGQILINGFNLHIESIIAKQYIGFLPDPAPLYVELTIREYLQLVAKLHYVPKEERETAIDSILEDLHLTFYQHYLIGMLSKGLKQRIGIAQAMLHRPSVLLLDEPTQGLDSTQIEAFQLLLRERKKGSAIILSTHYLNEVEFLCDYVIHLNHQDVKSYDINHCTA